MVPAEDTAAAVTDRNWKVPRTSWGDPNLEGIYSTDDMRSVPRERPEEFGTREKLTPEELAERAKADADTRDRIEQIVVLLEQHRQPHIRVDLTSHRSAERPDAGDERDRQGARARPNDRGTYGAGPFDTFEDFHLYDRCITRGILGSAFSVSYGNGMRIAQSPDSVVISYEMLTDSRVIALDRRDHAAPDNVKQYMGNSRGHWDGDTLVIETRNFNGKTAVGGNGIGVAAQRSNDDDRALDAHRPFNDRVRRNRERSAHVYSTVHRADDVDQPARLRDLLEYSCQRSEP